MNAVDFQFHLQKFVLTGACLVTAILVGLLLAGAPFLLVLALFGTVWLLTLPYHATIAIYLIIVTINSALIIPGVPGRPFWWELAAVLGMSGLVVSLALRRTADGAGTRLRQNLPFFIGLAGYCAVLLFLMYYRGVGIRTLGGATGQMGGRLYLQQLVCAVVPFLLVLNPLKERTLVRLFVLQCVLSITYLISDFAFAQGGRGPLYGLLLFLELPTDGANFEFQSMQFGIRRFQSFFTFALAMLSLLWVKRPLEDYANRNAVWTWPLTFGLLSIGVLSGHRHLIYISTVMLFFIAWAQRFLNPRRVTALLALSAILYLVMFAYVRSLPLAAQRALSFVPGIEVDRVAYEDGQATMEGRRVLRRGGLEVAQQYLWTGRGFGKIADLDPALYRYDMSFMNIDNGIFYNGTVGLLVNTGLPGTAFMFLLLGAGSVLAWRVIGIVRRLGAGDDFLRLSSLLASFWFSLVISFIFLHGDAEFALRTFAIPGGLLIACHWHLGRRLQATAVAPIRAEVVSEQPQLRPFRTAA